eukprot:TRINITY_DN2470_c0_g1_i1.p1 TRINITY_DN2470_c0_g1~~TRINITY_DN2470_c0_g1_i1.p1  ORF type:complete len:369 (+),score=76.15 TRINITY_DN2470_c0_g1_i1:342-1448(+)
MVEVQIKEELDKWTSESLKECWKSVFLNTDQQLPSKKATLIDMLCKHYTQVPIHPEFYSVESLRKELKARGVSLHSFSSKNDLQQKLQEVILNGDQTATVVDGEKSQIIKSEEGGASTTVKVKGKKKEKERNSIATIKREIDENNNGDEKHHIQLLPDENEAKNAGFLRTPHPTTPTKGILQTPPRRCSRLKKIRKVAFNEVEVREYGRVHGGSCSVPTAGGFPLGLAWEYDKEHIMTYEIDHFEDDVKRKRPVGDATYLAEMQRKNVLRDIALEFERGEITQEKKELKHIRETREDVGCQCITKNSSVSRTKRKGKSMTDCDVEECSCFANGIQCIDSCLCACEGCLNPNNPKESEVVVEEEYEIEV